MMMTNLSVLFYLKKRKTTREVQRQFNVRITVNSERAEVATGRECELGKRNSSAGRGSGNKGTG
jgi:hypothetical protein